MGYESFERGLWGAPFDLVDRVCKLRLGYEIIDLYDNEQTRTNLRVSKREEVGIGIDSDLPRDVVPKQLIDEFGDYHNWSTFSRDWGYIGLFTPNDDLNEAQHRVLYLITDEELADKDAMVKSARVNEVTGEYFTVETPSPHFDHLVNHRSKIVTSRDKLDKIGDTKWRTYAKRLCSLGMDSQLADFEEHRQKILEQLADINRGERILESAKPTVQAIEKLINQYIGEMN